MAEYNTAFTPPVATATTELYYAKTETEKPTQVFGVQGIPALTQPADDITYRTLESTEEFGAPGVKPFSAIEVTLLLYKEQYAAMKELSGELYWYVKLPESYGIIVKWKGGFSFTLAGLDLDDMCKCTLKIYKSTKPEEVAALPAGA